MGAYVYLPQEWSQVAFPFLYILRFQKYRFFQPQALLVGEIDICAQTFLYEIQI